MESERTPTWDQAVFATQWMAERDALTARVAAAEKDALFNHDAWALTQSMLNECRSDLAAAEKCCEALQALMDCDDGRDDLGPAPPDSALGIAAAALSEWHRTRDQ